MNIQSINSPLQNENSVFGKGKKTHKTKSHRVDKTRIQLKKSEVRQEIAKARKDEFVRTTQRSPEREAKILERKKTAIKQRMCALLGALGITAGVVGGVAVSSANQNSKPEDKTIVVTSNYDNEYDNDYDYVNYALDGGDIVEENIDKEVIQNAQPTSLNNEKLKIKAAENVEAIKLEQEKLMAQKLEVERLEKERLDKINWLNQVLEDDPELNKAYNDISAALETFSEQIGEDGYELINRYVDELGDGKVDPTDVYKVLFIESTGRIYDKNGNLLESASHAYGPFQIKKCAEEDINKNYETNYDVKKPYDNLAVNVLLLRWLNDFRTNQMEKGKNLPTGYNLKHAIMWGYHDGAYAKNISYYGQAYINEYDRLSKLDEYPELYDLMSGKLDTPITVESLNDET